MKEKIELDGKIIAIIIRSNFTKNGIEFFTPNDFSQQLGYMKREKGYQIKVSSFFDLRLWKFLHTPENNFLKIFGTLKGYLRRLKDLFLVNNYDLVYVFMWVTPLGSIFFEWLLRKLAKKLIYDFDDAVHLKHQSTELNITQKLVGVLRGRNKTNFLIKKADHVIVSSPFHVKYCKKNNYKKSCSYIPCSLNGERFVPLKHKRVNETVVIGWTGTFSSKFYLDSISEVFSELKKRCKFKLVLIGNFDYEFPLLDIEVKQWKKETEVEDLQLFDIGIYPLIEDDWSLGKGAMKAMHYMSIGIPVVATDFGTTSPIFLNPWAKPTNSHPSAKTVLHSLSQNCWSV